jgi:hypothetical protein
MKTKMTPLPDLEKIYDKHVWMRFTLGNHGGGAHALFEAGRAYERENNLDSAVKPSNSEDGGVKHVTNRAPDMSTVNPVTAESTNLSLPGSGSSSNADNRQSSVDERKNCAAIDERSAIPPTAKPLPCPWREQALWLIEEIIGENMCLTMDRQVDALADGLKQWNARVPSGNAEECARDIYYDLRGMSGAVMWGAADRARIKEVEAHIRKHFPSPGEEK